MLVRKITTTDVCGRLKLPHVFIIVDQHCLRL